MSLLLLTAGGWFDGLLTKPKKAAILIAVPIVFGLSFVPTHMEPTARLCAAPCAFALLTAAFDPTDHPFGALFAAVLGGVIGWKLCDAFPLFPEQGILIAVPTVLLAVIYCRDGSAKALAIAAAPFVMLLLRAVEDGMLFQSTVLELGNADALCAQSAGLALLLTGGLLYGRLRSVRSRARASA